MSCQVEWVTDILVKCDVSLVNNYISCACCPLGHVKKYPGLSSVAAEKSCAGRWIFFYESHLVGAQKKYPQTCSTVVWYNI